MRRRDLERLNLGYRKLGRRDLGNGKLRGVNDFALNLGHGKLR